MIASEIYSLIPAYFAHGEGVPDLDLKEEYRVYLRAILASDSRENFDLASMAFIAKLGNGHTWFGDWWLRNKSGQSLGFYAHVIDGEWTVSESQLSDLQHR